MNTHARHLADPLQHSRLSIHAGAGDLPTLQASPYQATASSPLSHLRLKALLWRSSTARPFLQVWIDTPWLYRSEMLALLRQLARLPQVHGVCWQVMPSSYSEQAQKHARAAHNDQNPRGENT